MENNTPHSAMARAKEVRKTRTGKEIKLMRPSSHEVAILRRISRGSLLVTIIKGTPHYTYEDGTVIRSGKDKAGFSLFTNSQFKKFVHHGWIVPDKSAPGLIGEVGQRYIVPSL